MDPISLGRSLYKEKDYNGALKAFTEASSKLYLPSALSRCDILSRIVLGISYFDLTSHI